MYFNGRFYTLKQAVMHQAFSADINSHTSSLMFLHYQCFSFYRVQLEQLVEAQAVAEEGLASPGKVIFFFSSYFLLFLWGVELFSSHPVAVRALPESESTKCHISIIFRFKTTFFITGPIQHGGCLPH